MASFNEIVQQEIPVLVDFKADLKASGLMESFGFGEIRNDLAWPRYFGVEICTFIIMLICCLISLVVNFGVFGVLSSSLGFLSSFAKAEFFINIDKRCSFAQKLTLGKNRQHRTS